METQNFESLTSTGPTAKLAMQRNSKKTFLEIGIFVRFPGTRTAPTGIIADEDMTDWCNLPQHIPFAYVSLDQ